MIMPVRTVRNLTATSTHPARIPAATDHMLDTCMSSGNMRGPLTTDTQCVEFYAHDDAQKLVNSRIDTGSPPARAGIRLFANITRTATHPN